MGEHHQKASGRLPFTSGGTKSRTAKVNQSTPADFSKINQPEKQLTTCASAPISRFFGSLACSAPFSGSTFAAPKRKTATDFGVGKRFGSSVG
ncbi:hypothetical protein [Hymenobacter cheonanensis]|uniref:hypothetical protein n=1 Tax=Hymenobacter sp. CA2-7 TaxID=3063993 RepID=UPI00272BD15C|nr:hypothetical protein [Hymenobacter sp. CA2-7]